MAAVAGIGLAVNLAVGALLLRGGGLAHGGTAGTITRTAGAAHAHGDLNLRAATLHVAGDALAGGGGRRWAGLAIARTGAAWIDPLLSLLVSAIIVAGRGRDRAPGHRRAARERARPRRGAGGARPHLRLVDGVVDVHDLHVWTIGSGSHALSAHVVLDDRKLSEASAILRTIDGALRAEFGIGHVTVQFECESCEPDTTIVCSQTARGRWVRPPADPSRPSLRGGPARVGKPSPGREASRAYEVRYRRPLHRAHAVRAAGRRALLAGRDVAGRRRDP